MHNVKNSLRHLVLRFEPTTSWTRTSTHNHYTSVLSTLEAFFGLIGSSSFLSLNAFSTSDSILIWKNFFEKVKNLSRPYQDHEDEDEICLLNSNFFHQRRSLRFKEAEPQKIYFRNKLFECNLKKGWYGLGTTPRLYEFYLNLWSLIFSITVERRHDGDLLLAGGRAHEHWRSHSSP